MSISVAVGSLAGDPPGWLAAGIVGDAVPVIASAANPRRRRELLWSRGLRANLVARLPANTNHIPVRSSITHDRHFAAVALSQCGVIGVDLQTHRPLESCHQIAETWFPAPEAKEIIHSENCERFLQSWVIKEAWAKCSNQSIFETCRSIAFWHGQVHVSGAADSPQFAWARQYVCAGRPDDGLCVSETGVTNPDTSTSGFAMGICLRGKGGNLPDIECLTPGVHSKLRRFAVDWEWLPVAGRAKSA